MSEKQPLPQHLGDFFGVGSARGAGVALSRLYASDLERPFHGVRATAPREAPDDDPWDNRRAALIWRAKAFAAKLPERTFFSHETASAVYGAPIRLAEHELVDVTTLGAGPLIRTEGVRAHRVKPRMAALRTVDGLRLSSPATTWAMLGATCTLEELVQIGDYFCRVWRGGVGRSDAGKAPLATIDELRAAIEAGRRLGAPTLREALTLVRTDSWSPRETSTRLAIVGAGLPEPELNVDVIEAGRFLGCVDLCYPEARIAIEYQGRVHAAQYAADVERVERLREAGWIVIQVTSALIRTPHDLIRRLRQAFAARG